MNTYVTNMEVKMTAIRPEHRTPYYYCAIVTELHTWDYQRILLIKKYVQYGGPRNDTPCGNATLF